MGVDTHKVEVVPVVLEKHPNADKLSVVRVYNFTCVVNTADWQGVTQAAYVQPDSVMPDKPEYRFLKETGNLRKEREALLAALEMEHESDLARLDIDMKLADLEKRIDSNTKRLRITVVKLRGVISMGMLLRAPEGSQIGDDVADILGVTHYEPPMIGLQKGDKLALPPPMIYAPEYDVESVYKYADAFEQGEMVYVSEKLDGQNARYVVTREDSGVCHCGSAMEGHSQYDNHSALDNQIVVVHAGSRTEWKAKESNSNWWRALDQNPWIEEFISSHPGCVLYGEVFGWVAPLRYGAKQGQLFFRAFDVMQGMEYWDAEKFLAEVPEQHRVPTLGVMPFDFERLQVHADGKSHISGADHMREGIVIKPLKERKHWKLGRVMLKMVSNAYLEKSAR
jgi:RNA ligase (TIGR02306 family)